MASNKYKSNFFHPPPTFLLLYISSLLFLSKHFKYFANIFIKTHCLSKGLNIWQQLSLVIRQRLSIFILRSRKLGLWHLHMAYMFWPLSLYSKTMDFTILPDWPLPIQEKLKELKNDFDVCFILLLWKKIDFSFCYIWRFNQFYFCLIFFIST